MKTDHFSDNLEQSQETVQAPHKLAPADLLQIESAAGELTALLNSAPDGDMVAQIIETAIKLLRDHANRGDLKLMTKSMKEIRYALKVFAPYRDVRKVSIFGSARTPEDDLDYKSAANFARCLAKAGWMVITGAGGGIMAAGHGGGGPEPSFGLAIRLPFEQQTNPHIATDKKLINFKYFFTRKLMFVRSSHAIALFPGGFGTMDEGFEVLTLIQTGKSVPMPVVFVDRPGGNYWRGWMDYVEHQLLRRGLISREDLSLFKITDDVAEAVHEVTHFYSNYHSIRYAREELVMRLQRRPSDKQLADIAERFKDISLDGKFRLSAPLPVERDEPALANLPRLVFAFNKKDQGRLRMLIDYLNSL